MSLAAKSADAGSPLAITPVADLLTRAVQRYAERTAIDFLGFRLTYRELGSLVDRAALGFAESGRRQGRAGRPVSAQHALLGDLLLMRSCGPAASW